MNTLPQLVCFASSFRLSGARGGVESPNITHATLDGERTLCGKREWMTVEGWDADLIGCLHCDRAYSRRVGVKHAPAEGAL